MSKSVIEIFHKFRSGLTEATGDKEPLRQVRVTKRVWALIEADLKGNGQKPDSSNETRFCGVKVIKDSDDSDFVPVCTCWIDDAKCRRHPKD